MKYANVVPHLHTQQLFPVAEILQSKFVEYVIVDIIADLGKFGAVELVSGEKVFAQ